MVASRGEKISPEFEQNFAQKSVPGERLIPKMFWMCHRAIYDTKTKKQKLLVFREISEKIAAAARG